MERLKEEADILERDWRRIPFLLLTALLAAPAYFVWGPLAAIFALIAAPCLVLTALYLIGVRKSENRQSIAELERQLMLAQLVERK